MKMPELPEGQRWLVYKSMGTFLHVKLQEKGRWGWRTIAESLEYLSLGEEGVRRCVERIQNRDYLARIAAERDAERAESYARIPFGTHGG